MSKRGKGSKSGGRGLSGRGITTRVKTARRRRPSSTRWLRRQLNDPYVREARAKGYPSRAAFKLIELDDKFHFLKPGQKVIDLGAAPGGWSQVAAERCGAAKGKSLVVALDVTAMEPRPGVMVITADFMEDDTPGLIRAALGGPADVVLSDMAAPATGHKGTDHLRVMALAEAAFAFAETILSPGGVFIAKVFQGGSEGGLLDALKRRFKTVKHAKPPASRAESAEVYVLAQGFRGVP
jgi:23S rRNA (uridine2552-2'-O)-methyltransferase